MFLIFALLNVGLTALLFDWLDDDDQDKAQKQSDEPSDEGMGDGDMGDGDGSGGGDGDDLPPDLIETFLVAGQSLVSGTQAADRFERDPDAETYDNASVEGGAGDDQLALFDPETDDVPEPFDLSFDAASIDAGPGDDSIDVFATNSTIEGGEGEDTITGHVFAGGTRIAGGAGDDMLLAELDGGDLAGLDGGEGNDTVDARLMVNVEALGGEGDDEVLLSAGGSLGAGFSVIGDGGEGNDTIFFEDSAIDASSAADFAEAQVFSPAIGIGGPGADTFHLTLTEGGDFAPGDPPPDTESVALRVFDIDDFEPGTDMVVVEPQTRDDDYTVTDARLDGSQLVLTYEHPTKVTREVSVSIGDGVTPDDIAFISNSPLGIGVQTVTTSGEDFDGGDGNDTITAFAPGSVTGGAGNDILTTGDDDNYGLSLAGGAGDDTLSGANMASGQITGGPGDDSFTFEQVTYSAEPPSFNGGAGDDSFAFDLSVIETASASGGNVDSNFIAGNSAIGGPGADSFDITLNVSDLTQPGTIAATYGDASDVAGRALLSITDFDLSEDQLVIDLASSPDVQSLHSITAQEVASSGTTEVTLSFLATDGETYDAVINLGVQPPGFDVTRDVSVLLP